MKLYSLTLLLFISLSTMHGCGGDNEEPAPVEQFVTDEYTDALANAKIYLTYEAMALPFEEEPLLEPRLTRTYIISDGVYTNADGSYGDFGSFEDETYLISLSVISEDENELKTGDYTTVPFLSDNNAPGELQWSEDKIAHIFQTKYLDIIHKFTDTEYSDAPISITGGLNGNQTMTVKFKGRVFLHGFDSDPDGYYSTGDLYVKAKVSDVRHVFPAGARRIAQERPEFIDKLLNLRNK